MVRREKQGKKAAGETVKASGVLVYASGEVAEKVAVGERAKRFRAVAYESRKSRGEDRRLRQAVWPLQAVERGESNAKTAVQAESFNALGLQLRVG